RRISLPVSVSQRRILPAPAVARSLPSGEKAKYDGRPASHCRSSFPVATSQIPTSLSAYLEESSFPLGEKAKVRANPPRVRMRPIFRPWVTFHRLILSSSESRVARVLPSGDSALTSI